MKAYSAIALLACAIVSGCSSNDIEDHNERMEEARVAQKERQIIEMDKQIDSIPDWFLDIPMSDTVGVYAVGFGTSNRPTFALRTAELQAKFDLAKNFKQMITGQERSYETQGAGDIVQSQINVLIDSLVEEMQVAGFERVKRQVINVDGKANAYVLLKMPYEEFNRALQSVRAKSFDEKMEMAFNKLENRIADRKALKQTNIQNEHKRTVELQEVEIKRSVELRKAELKAEQDAKLKAENGN
ncbi:hypothetical protein [uncultured Pseudoalteromonas sp.]|uniref:hypothetical protein n=1 Tax=uncultured Pseudoalteromonas sp. TaxID=114053 RepID=UPI002598E635|nr:hypothetical protein [uncultured Pseudoalteromonas sp.]